MNAIEEFKSKELVYKFLPIIREKFNSNEPIASVRDVVDTIRMYIPSLDVKFVDHKIMNQLSYEVSYEKFSKTGLKVTDFITKINFRRVGVNSCQ
jgi:hypothetical protein